MATFRHLTCMYRPAVLLLLACTLAVRLLVPSGYMPVVTKGVVALSVCPGVQAAASHTGAMAGMHHGDRDDGGHGKMEVPCDFAGVGHAALDSVPSVILASALLFVVLLALHATIQPARKPRTRLRPPLRAPPLMT